MKRIFVAFFALQVLAGTANAVDHNNLDAGRPLDFDDAQSIAWNERAVEFGAASVKPRHGKSAVMGSAEFLYGFAPNTHFSLDFDPKYLQEGSNSRRFDVGDIGVGIFHNFNREFGRIPAFSLRADAALPTGRDSRGVDVRLRAIASQQFRQYERLHLNIDFERNGGANNSERILRPALTLGYSRPLDFPRRFTRTLLAQIGVKASEARGQNSLGVLGIGLRQQVSVRGVLDVGLTGEFSGASESEFRLVVGYSTQF